MTKRKVFFDSRQPSLFEIIRNFQSDAPAKPPGSFNVDRAFREAVSEDLRRCPLSRYQVAARMSELTDTDITKTMLDSWTAESKVLNRFPAVFISAFCETVGSANSLRLLGQPVGVFVLPGPEALRAEIKRIEEEIERKQVERRRRLAFLKEMEGER